MLVVKVMGFWKLVKVEPTKFTAGLDVREREEITA